MTDTSPTVPERLKALESALLRLRQQLDEVTAQLGSNPANTRLVIQRVNVMKQIMAAQSEIDQLRNRAGG
jgi:predicted component of type VI protein secretion system